MTGGDDTLKTESTNASNFGSNRVPKYESVSHLPSHLSSHRSYDIGDLKSSFANQTPNQTADSRRRVSCRSCDRRWGSTACGWRAHSSCKATSSETSASKCSGPWPRR